MSAKRKPTKELKPLSNAMTDFMHACMSFPTYGDVSWKLKHPHANDPKKKKAS